MAVAVHNVVSSVVASRNFNAFVFLGQKTHCLPGNSCFQAKVCVSFGGMMEGGKQVFLTEKSRIGARHQARRAENFSSLNGTAVSHEAEVSASNKQVTIEPTKKKASVRRRKAQTVNPPNRATQGVDSVASAKVSSEVGNNRLQDTESEGEDLAKDNDIEIEKGYKMSHVCNRLMEVLLYDKPKPEEWRTLLAYSDEWRKIRPHFYKLSKVREKAETNPEKRSGLKKFVRSLKEVDDDMEQHNQLLAELEKESSHLDVVVVERCRDFTDGFFDHLRLLCEVNHNNLMRKEEIAELATKCLAFVIQYDEAIKDKSAFAAAERKFDKVLSSLSLDAACEQIDKLAEEKELDAVLMLVITKAWISAKNSTIVHKEGRVTSENIKSIMYHLYMTARGNIERLVPKEVHLLKYLISIEDPHMRFTELTKAFSPGDDLERKGIDATYTKPDKLLKWVKVILDAYHANKAGALIKEAQKLTDPQVIGRLETLKSVVEDEFL